MAVGLGATAEAVGTTILVLVALLPLQRLEARAYKRPIASTDTPKPADEGR
jgi:uncharacterized membrane protein YhiD involved in acid resistance